MGGDETEARVSVEPTVGYHLGRISALTLDREPVEETVSGGQFGWGGPLLKGNGGIQRFPQAEWKPAGEYKGRREPDC